MFCFVVLPLVITFSPSLSYCSQPAFSEPLILGVHPFISLAHATFRLWLICIRCDCFLFIVFYINCKIRQTFIQCITTYKIFNYFKTIYFIIIKIIFCPQCPPQVLLYPDLEAQAYHPHSLTFSFSFLMSNLFLIQLVHIFSVNCATLAVFCICIRCDCSIFIDFDIIFKLDKPLFTYCYYYYFYLLLFLFNF